MGETRETESIDALVERLKERVAARRAAGEYPPDLEQSLDAHFHRIAVHRAPSYDFDVLRDKLDAVTSSSSFDPRRIDTGSRAPGGSAVHKTVAKAVGRQTQGILEQVQSFADAVRAALWELLAALETPRAHEHQDLVSQIDAVLERFAEYERTPDDPHVALAELRRRVELLEEVEGRRRFQPWFSNARFEQEFRGTREELLARYDDLAGRFAGCDPVVDVGCGRGEFLTLLRKHGIDAIGVEVDGDLVQEVRSAGHEVEHADAVSWLRRRPDASLGGISLIQVVEHLTPQEVVDVAALAAEKLRPGGRLLIETVNPQSLYVYAHSFYLDPSHVSPVHPAYLHFLFREAGFGEVAIEWRSPCPPDDVLQEVPDGPAADVVNQNVARLNQLLFAAQDYALIATR